MATPSFSRAAVMRLTELRRTGAGTLEEGLTKFEWSGPSHSAMQGTLDLELMAKTVRKEMPGSNEVVEQGLSATWQPFEMSGEWDDKWAGQGFAMAMYNDIAVFVSRMPLVRFTLDRHSIVGILTSLKIRYKTASKISWTLMMSPHKNETIAEVTFSVFNEIERKPVDQWWKQFQAQRDVLTRLRVNARGIPLGTDILVQFDSFLSVINEAVDKLGDVATRGLESDTQRRLLHLASTFRRIRGAGLSAAYGIQQQTSTIDLAYEDVIATLSYDEWVNNTRTELWKSIGFSRQAEIDMNHRLGRKPKAIYRPRARESLERISVRFYGTPDNALKIYEANNLKTSVLIGTEELLIPELAA